MILILQQPSVIRMHMIGGIYMVFMHQCFNQWLLSYWVNLLHLHVVKGIGARNLLLIQLGETSC